MPPLTSFRRSCLALALSQALGSPAQAAEILVNSLSDTMVADEECTLREAIISANTDDNRFAPECVSGKELDSIYLQTPGIIVLESSLPEIETSVYISGLGINETIISGNQAHQIFSISGSSTNEPNVTIQRVTLQEGLAGRGAAVEATQATVTILNSLLTENYADSGGAASFFFSQATMEGTTVRANYASGGAGGIDAYGQGSSLVLRNSAVTQNFSERDGGGVRVKYQTLVLENSIIDRNQNGIDGSSRDGGGIYAVNADLQLIQSEISSNYSMQHGGGIYARDSNVEIENTKIQFNGADVDGGGIHARDSTMSVSNAQIFANSAAGYGGGAMLREAPQASIVNTSISSNYAGGGIALFDSSSLSMTNSTLSTNQGRAGLYAINSMANLEFCTITNNQVEGLRSGFSGEIRFADSIISGNARFAVKPEIAGYSIYESGIYSSGTNLLGNNSNSRGTAFTSFSPGPTDILATSDEGNMPLENLLSTTLDDNGCLIQAGRKGSQSCVFTHLLVENSPALRVANSANCPDSDQRGKARDQSQPFFIVAKAANNRVVTFDLGEDVCDIGAVEGINGLP
ncbi:MAG: right-handed parallel beta-helix repeat-containing protein [Gammaproteobacteria bacterium]|nr:right-handed parallel beta-helix repeat-containing protein [Gammaproteobacteria bacterium]